MDAGGGTGPLSRPLPPGRRRPAPQSRNVSSASDTPSTGGRRISVAKQSIERETANSQNAASSNNATLFVHTAMEDRAPSPSEIPLEEVEEALSGLNREDLVLALKRAKEQMDIMDVKMDGYIERNELLESRLVEFASEVRLGEAENESLQIALQQREDRVDELMREQDRDENEVFAKAGVIERLRKRLDESEKGRAEAEKRCQLQISSADKERQSFSDMESLMQTQKAKASTAHERLIASNHELEKENGRLQQMLLQARLQPRGLSRSPVPQSSLEDEASNVGVGTKDVDLARQNDLTEEAAWAGESNIGTRHNGIRTLQDEARASEVEALRAELFTQQKSHDMLTSQLQQLQTDLQQEKATNTELRDQNETYMDILQEKTFSGTLIMESAMLSGRYLESSTEESESDDMDDVPDEPAKRVSRKRREVTSKRSQDLSQLPASLASELEKSESQDNVREGSKRNRRKERSEMLTDNVEELHKEVWALRDANQALTLYVNKILDRIIAKEGYENVLAIDGDDKSKLGTLRGPSSRSRGQRADLTTFNTPDAKATRRASGGGLLAFMGAGGYSNPADDGETVKTPTAASPSLATKARRTASIDWRALLGGASASTAQASSASPLSPAPRKISSSEEVEDAHDKAEKEKIRQAMISHGFSPPDYQLQSSKRASGLGTFLTRVIRTGAPLPEEESSRWADEGTVIDRGKQHPGPRLTTFDSVKSSQPGSARSQSRTGNSNDSNSLTRHEARQRALEMGNAGNLTEMPRRTSPISSRRNTLKRADTSSTSGNSSTSAGEVSRSESLAGDESYQFSSPLSSKGGTLPSEKVDEIENGWGKTLKRMSILGARPDRTS